MQMTYQFNKLYTSHDPSIGGEMISSSIDKMLLVLTIISKLGLLTWFIHCKFSGVKTRQITSNV